MVLCEEGRSSGFSISPIFPSWVFEPLDELPCCSLLQTNAVSSRISLSEFFTGSLTVSLMCKPKLVKTFLKKSHRRGWMSAKIKCTNILLLEFDSRSRRCTSLKLCSPLLVEWSHRMLLLSSSLGVLIAHAANHNVSLHIKSTRRFINTNLRDLRTFANNTPAVRLLTQTHQTSSSWRGHEHDWPSRFHAVSCFSHFLPLCLHSKSSTWPPSTPRRRTKSCLSWIVSQTCTVYFTHCVCPTSLAFVCSSISSVWSCPVDIGPLLGGRIHSQLEKEVIPSLDTALRMAGGNWAPDGPMTEKHVTHSWISSLQTNPWN